MVDECLVQLTFAMHLSEFALRTHAVGEKFRWLIDGKTETPEVRLAIVLSYGFDRYKD